MPPSIKLEPIRLSKPLINTSKLMSGLQRAVDDTTAIADRDFKATVKTWKRKPTFRRKRVAKVRGGLSGDVTTRDEIYGYVTFGTRPHLIPKRPKRGGSRLAFRTGYRAKTRPRVLGSRGGGARGPMAFARQVRHPGTEARRFQQEVAARRQRNIRNFAIRAYAEARR